MTRLLRSSVLVLGLWSCASDPEAARVEPLVFTPDLASDEVAVVARIPSQGFALRMTTDGLRVALGAQASTLRTVHVGRAGERARPTMPASLVSRGARAELHRGAVVEWFEARERGVEHGLDLAARPEGVGVLEIEVAVEGALHPVLVGGGVELHDARAVPRARYGALFAFDADRRTLPSQLAVREGRIVWRVDDADARYPIVIDPLLTADVAELRATDGSASDELGGTPFETSGGPSVAVDGDYAAVAAPWDGAGSVYVFSRVGGAWTQQAKIDAPAAMTSGARFGYAVALASDRLVVGAPLAGTGHAFVYSRVGAAWSLEQALVAPGVATGEQLGVAVATDGTTTVVGARYEDDGARPGGAAHVFVRSGTTWTHQQRLHGSDQAAGDDFGSAVAVDGTTAVVGAIFHTSPGFAGAAYVFTRSGATWSQQAKLVASDAAPLDQFARSLALDGDLVVVGAPQNQITLFNEGAAYVFTRSGGTWSQTTRLVGATPVANDQLGYSVALFGEVVALGARFDDTRATDAGAVAFFERTSAGWLTRAERTAPDGAAGDRFGDSVALSADTLVVGAPFTDDAAANVGSAYVISVARTGALGDVCTGASDCIGGRCVDGVCCDDACGGGATDCQACSVAAGGVTDGTCGPLRAAVASTRTCRGAVGSCDVAESCSSTARVCPADTFVAAGTTCRVVDGPCDAPETCSGLGPACPPDVFLAGGTVCRAAEGPCDAAESCSGLGPACPTDGFVADGTSCGDGVGCNGDEVCVSGSCDVGMSIDCDDADPCTADACTEPGTCVHEAIVGCCTASTDCDDGDPCTADACEGMRCVSTPIAGCGDAGVPDGGVSDGGVDDGGVSDGGGLDGGVSDGGGLEDGGVSDGGVDDGGADDAGLDGGAADAATRMDAGPTIEDDSDGCGCRAPGASTDRRSVTWLALVGVLLWRRRRSRHRVR